MDELLSESPRKVAICGTAPTSFQLAPFGDPEWEIWGTSRLYQAIPRYDVWFELHDLDTIGKGWACDENKRREERQKHLDWLASQKQPIYLQHEDERVPAGVKYPLADVESYLDEEFGHPSDQPYFTNHISYMIALAIYEQVDVLGVWGVDMALADGEEGEYAYQRPSCEYLLGIARGAGIDVHIPKESDLLKAIHRYGYEDDTAFHRKLRARKKELEQRLSQAKSKKQEIIQKRASLAGRLDLVEQLCENGVSEELKHELEKHGEQVAQQGVQLEQKLSEVNSQILSVKGAKSDIDYIHRSWR